MVPVLTEWHACHAPPVYAAWRRGVRSQPRVPALIFWLTELSERLGRERLPAGLPPPVPETRPAGLTEGLLTARASQRYTCDSGTVDRHVAGAGNSRIGDPCKEHP